MKSILNFFKSIWNFFFGKKESHLPTPNYDAYKKVVDSYIKKPQTQLFRNQQLPGKIFNIGKSRFRIKKLLGIGTEKLKYEITHL